MLRAWIAGLALAALAVPAVAVDAGSPEAAVDSVDAYLARTDAFPVAPAAGPLLTPMDGGWDFRVTAWIIAPKANIEAKIDGKGGHLETDYGDTFISGARVEAIGRHFGGLLELQAGGLDSNDTASDYTLTDMRADIGLIFRVIGLNEGRALKLDLFGGARYHQTTQDAGIDDDDEWWEPFAGAEVRIPFLIGDIVSRVTASGFDVGPTTLQLTATAAIEFLIGPVFAQIGVRYEDQHFTTSSGGGYEVDAQSFGPFVAFGLDF